VLSAVAEVLGLSVQPAPAHLVTGLSVGRQCGALSAGFVAISLVHGRSRPPERATAERCWALSRTLRDRFEEALGSSLCEDLYQAHLAMHGSCEFCYAKGAELAAMVLLKGREA
jgi:hypothetical protein